MLANVAHMMTHGPHEGAGSAKQKTSATGAGGTFAVSSGDIWHTRRLPGPVLRRIIARMGVLRIVADVLATAGVFLALAGTQRDTSILLLLSALVIVCARGGRALRRSARFAVGPTGSAVLARVLLAVGIAADFAPTSVGSGGSHLRAAAAAAALAVLAEAAVAPIARLAVPYVAKLPGIDVRNEPRLAPKWLFATNTTTLAGLAVALSAHRTGPLILLMAAGQWLILSFVVADVSDRIWQRRRAEAGLTATITEYAPTFVVHWYAPTGSKHQLTMWLPYLERLGRPFMIIVRNPGTFAEIVGETTRPVLVRRYGPELAPVVVPSLTTVFYVNTSPRNEPMLAFLGLHQIQLNHGDSDKAPSYRRAFRLYDKNFVAGQAAVDRFARHGVEMPASTFEIVGRPQVETITVADTPVGHRHAKTVLYAPTWHGYLDDSRYSSLPVGELIVAALLERNCTVIFRPHPWTGRTPHLADHAGRVNAFLREDAASSGRSHLYGASATDALSLVDCFNRSDAMIADVSSVVSDFVYSEKPYAVTAMGALTSAAELVGEFPLARGGYLLGADGVDWARVLDDLLIYDPKLLERRSLKSYYLGPFPADSYADAFVSAALRNL
jgi:hypothetical protein